MRKSGGIVIHIHYIVEPGAPGLKLNAPLFRGLAESKAVVRGTWGAAPVEGLEPQKGDVLVEKMRMNGFHGTKLEYDPARIRDRFPGDYRGVDEFFHRTHGAARRRFGL